mgnify:FL=1
MATIGVLPITFKDILDIVLVATILYGFFRLLRRSGATNLFWGILLFVITWFVVTSILQLEMTGAIFDMVMSVGALALIVIFQDELRGFIYRLGASVQFSGWKRLFLRHKNKSHEHYIDEIKTACRSMSANKTGALIVLEGNVSLNEYVSTGELLDADVSARLLENIFFKNPPLHDGALIITRGRIRAAACILPVSKDATIPQHYGLRHRAALGIAERTDALAIVVSEESGNISVARDGMIRTINADELMSAIITFVH